MGYKGTFPWFQPSNKRVDVQMIFQRMSRFRTTIITGIKGTVKGQNNDLWESVLPSTSRTNLAAWKCINTTFPISRVPPVSANIRIIREYFCLLHNANVQLIFSRVIGFKVVFRRYWHPKFQLERFSATNTDDFFERPNPILIQTSTKRAFTHDYNMKPEVRKSIGLRDRTEDGVDILKDRKRWCAPWRIPFPWWFTE